MCDKEFRTMKINSLFCSKLCGNRSRSLPAKLKQSLVKRSYRFSVLEDNRPEHIISSDIALCEYNAREEAKRRGIKPSTVIEDNLKYINTTDPANGDSTGFKKQEEIHNDNDFVNGNSVSHTPVNGESEDSNGSNGNASTISSSSIAGEFPRGKGIRKIGVLKKED